MSAQALACLVELASSPALLGLMALAVALGLVVGAVPGLGGKTAITLAIPFVFGMDALPGAVFLLAMHAVVHTGDTVPSILLGIPGTGPAAATVLDGHPMARQGLAGRALGASLTASAVGGVIGAAALALALPLLQPLVLRVGPAEIFLLAVLGICLIPAVSGEDLGKGLAVGVLGVLLACVGMDALTGAPRYTFGWLFLWDGVDLTTAMLAIFAVPEMVELGARGGAVASAAGAAGAPGASLGWRWRQLLDGVADVGRHWGLALRTSLLGVGVGTVPGLGGEVASWVSYGHAVQSAKDPARFGRGAVEGVIAPETANNSKEGGSLVPTLLFAVPGSSGMALLLGAFTVLGIAPGPRLFLEQPALVWTLVWALALSNVLGSALLLVAAPWVGRLAFVRIGRLVPVVFVLAIVGSFAVTATWECLPLLVAVSALGWAMKRGGWPRAPFAIGLVLGEIAEVTLHQSLVLFGPAFLLRPGCLALLVAVAAALVFSRARRAGRAAPEARPRLRAELGLVAWFAGLAASVLALGFSLGVPPVVLAFLRFRQRERLAPALALAAPSSEARDAGDAPAAGRAVRRAARGERGARVEARARALLARPAERRALRLVPRRVAAPAMARAHHERAHERAVLRRDLRRARAARRLPARARLWGGRLRHARARAARLPERRRRAGGGGARPLRDPARLVPLVRRAGGCGGRDVPLGRARLGAGGDVRRRLQPLLPRAVPGRGAAGARGALARVAAARGRARHRADREARAP
jgi:TctA family transporter